jgi:hypothetical protein
MIRETHVALANMTAFGPLLLPIQPKTPPAPSKKKQVTSRFPFLGLDAAIEWRTKKKEADSWRNRFKRERLPEPTLPGEWLFKRIGSRDHVSNIHVRTTAHS